jgi:molybdopterin/thiamine biosynthesis adenylyltransferase
MTDPTPSPGRPVKLFDDQRFGRFELISWWDQTRLKNSRVLVIGAGALGNEILKNLALLGVGQVVVVDLDTIEHSNLTRSVLFRAADVGKAKSEVAALRAKELWPDLSIRALRGDIIHDIGAGVFRWADVVIGGLDNREARLAINRHCWRLNKPFVDGAIEVIQGIARVFRPDEAQQSPCYECTLTKNDWQLIEQRRSCAMLSRQQLDTGHTPTTPTIASIIAGIQVQEAIKLLHQLDVASGKGIVFMGQTPETYPVEYTRNPSCQSHEPFTLVVESEFSAHSTTAKSILQFASTTIGVPVDRLSIRIGKDVIRSLRCDVCAKEELLFHPASKVKADRAKCDCGTDSPRRVTLLNDIRFDDADANRTLGQLHFAPFDVIQVVAPDPLLGVELSADAPHVLGDLAAPGLEMLE